MMNCRPSFCSPSAQNLVVQKGLDLKLRAKTANQCLKWGSVNVMLLAILLFDISNKCPFVQSPWYYVEYAATGIVALSVFACFCKYFLYLFHTEPVQGTKEQKNLLRFEDNDSSFVTTPPGKIKKQTKDEAASNNSIIVWHSSFNDSRTGMSPNWSCRGTTPPRLSPQQQQQQHAQQQQQLNNTSWNNSSFYNQSLNQSNLSSNASFMSPYYKYKDDDLITDEQSLQKYLKEVSLREQSLQEPTNLMHAMPHGTINSFWNYCNSAANMIKTSIYQLAPTPAVSTPSKQTTTEEGGLNILDSNSEVIKRISAEKLSQYVANLRVWLATTILHRLVREINHIDEAFKNRGLTDMLIGSISLERLKKTAENQQFVNQCAPMLPLVIPFLELSNNQEYLVNRIKELAKGSCIAEYRWNSDANYHGIKWEENLPTDSAILFHLFCVYMDSQLMPLPQGGGRPFYNRYIIVGDVKRSAKETLALVKNKAHCAILFSNNLRPRFNFISDKEIHNCANDRNNLFYVIIQFLLYMKNQHDSALEGVNLGRSGINIMCVIED